MARLSIASSTLFKMKSLLLLTVIAAVCSNVLTKDLGTRGTEASDNVLVKTEDNLGTQINGGSKAKDEDFPFAVLRAGDGCSGMIVGDRYILTAKHCAGSIHDDPVVWVGSTSFDRAEKHKIRCVSWFPYDDAMLLQLEEPLKFSKTIQPIALSLKHPAINETYIQVSSGHGVGEVTWMEMRCTTQRSVQWYEFTPIRDDQEVEMGDSGGAIARREGGIWFLYGLIARKFENITIAVNGFFMLRWVTEQMNHFKSDHCYRRI